jgi:hypothetical protein
MLAQMQIEALKSADIDSPALAPMATADPSIADPNNPIDENGLNGGIYNRSWRVIDNTPFSRRVIVTVAWNNRAISMSTITRGSGN